MTNYWVLTLKDGEEIRVKPEDVPIIKQKIDAGGNIQSATRVLLVSEIKGFVETDQPYIDKQKLLEAGEVLEGAARAFNEPLLTPDGAIIAKWVKKSVPNRLWVKHYANIPGYKRIDDDGAHTMVAFRLPVHQISNLVEEMSEEEIRNAPTQLE